MPRPTRAQIDAKTAELREQAAERERERMRIRYDIAMDEDREVGPIHQRLTQAQMAADGLVEGAKHVSGEGLIVQQMRDAARANAYLDSSADFNDSMIVPEPTWTPVAAFHERAGSLRLATDGASWLLRLRGMEYGCGTVKHCERSHTADGTPVFTPRAEVIERAAAYALADPTGPESPVGAVYFTGGPDGEPVEHRLAAPEPAEVGNLRRKINKLRSRT